MRRILLVVGLSLLSLGSLPGARADNEPLVPDLETVQFAPQLMAGDFFLPDGTLYVLLAYSDPDAGVVRIRLSAYDDAPFRHTYAIDAPANAMTVSPDNRDLTLDVDVPGIGRVFIELSNSWPHAYSPAYGCINPSWGFEFAAPPSGRIADPLAVSYEGTIGGTQIETSFCRTVGQDVSGAWYALGIRP
jgi:hypothetical protein